MTSSAQLTRPTVALRIAGKSLTTGSGGVYEHINPATGMVDAEIPLAGQSEVDDAVAAANEAFHSWRTTRPAERRELLTRLADLMAENRAEFTRLGTFDNGTPQAVVEQLVDTSIEWTRYYAGWADKLTSEVTGTLGTSGEFSYSLGQPYGVIGVIITWNGPLVSLAMKIPAALAAGNTVVVKPSELTPFSAGLFMDLADQAGIPPGVINILPGSPESGAALVAHPLVKKVTFTGGPETARKILRSCAEQIKPAVLELGGKSANIIFDDANLETATSLGTLMSVGALSGQGCAFPTRMIVQDTIYEEVIERVKAIAGYFVVGDPLAPGTVSGPVINAAALDRILGMIERAKADGARLVTGGSRIGGDLANGYFLEPTVFADVDPYSELAQKEVFGPVLSIIRFSTEAEAIEIANCTEYGLSGYIHTNDLVRAHRVAEELVTGEVLINGATNLMVNRPFGGIGLSGLGKEGGRAGIDEFLRVKNIGIAQG